jgi:hypothetical protein
MSKKPEMFCIQTHPNDQGGKAEDAAGPSGSWSGFVDLFIACDRISLAKTRRGN